MLYDYNWPKIILPNCSTDENVLIGADSASIHKGRTGNLY